MKGWELVYDTYDPADGRWHQVWMDAGNARVTFEGYFANGQMILTGDLSMAAATMPPRTAGAIA